MKVLNLARGEWRYDEAAPLGEKGGFATVYAGWSADGRPVAIKLFHDAMKAKADRELAFASSRVGRSTSHLITIHDAGVDAAHGQPAIVMTRGEYSLSAYVKKQGPQPEAAACAIAGAIARGLIDASEWVHRDLKPDNVLWCEGRWRLVDFGIARMANASTATGTLKPYRSVRYAAPEQWNDEHATHATDVYALGCVLHELLTGNPLFDGDSFEALAHQHRVVPAPITAGSSKLRSLLLRMLAKPQEARPTLDELSKRLNTLASGPATGERSPSLLSAASAAVSAERAEREAAAAQSRRELRTRDQLGPHALSVLKPLQDELFERIRAEAPEARIINTGSVSAPVMEVRLGQGQLSMSLGHMRDIPREIFHASGWDVICWDQIQCSQPRYRRSASLWYVNDGSGEWRWLEVAYFCWKQDNGESEPCSLAPGRDAALAAAPVMSSWNFAHPPYAIEGSGREAFFVRWMNYLAEAAAGKLCRPGNLPEA